MLVHDNISSEHKRRWKLNDILEKQWAKFMILAAAVYVVWMWNTIVWICPIMDDQQKAIICLIRVEDVPAYIFMKSWKAKPN